MKYLPLFTIIILTLISCNNESSQRKKVVDLKDSAYKAIENNEYQSAINSAKKALEIFTEISDTTGIVESNYLISRASALLGDFDNAVLYGEKGSHLCKIIENYPLEYKINNTLSWAYFTQGRSFDENLEHNKRQLFVVEQIQDDNAKAMVHNNYGYDATVSGKVPLNEAIGYMKFANSHYVKTEKNNGRWNTLMNLTWQYRLINNLSKSEEYGRLAVEQAEADNDRHAIIEVNTNLGETLLAQNKIEEARPLYERGLEISKQKDDRDKYVFDVYYSRYLWETGKKDEAISLLKNAVGFLESSEIFYEMQARAFLADYYFSIGNIEGAEKQVKKFKNPRARYFSQEAKAIASSVEAQIVSAKDKERAIGILNNQLRELDKSGAESLKVELLKLKEQM
jgi:tetratricopeptide (TPR) repeat protein